jgi:hypothetical protein
MLKIQQKVVLLSCFIAWSATLGVGVLDYCRDTGQATRTAQRILQGQAAFVDRQLKNALNELLEDGALISTSLELASAATEDGGAGVEPLTDESSSDRFERVFRTIMQVRPSYTSMALLSLDPGRQEIVRLTRTSAGQIGTTAPRGGLPIESLYVRARFLEPGSWAFAEPTDVSEKIDAPMPPVQSYVFLKSLVRANGEPVAYLAVELDMADLVSRVLTETNPDYSTLVAGRSGEVLGARIAQEDMARGVYHDPPMHSDLPAALLFDTGNGSLFRNPSTMSSRARRKRRGIHCWREGSRPS